MQKYGKAVVNLVIALIVLLLIIFLVPKLLVLFAPFVAGYIIALIASPMARFVEKRFRVKRKTGSAVVIILVIGLVVLFIYLAGGKLIDEMSGFISELPELWSGLKAEIEEIGRNYSKIYKRLPMNIQETFEGLGEQVGVYIRDVLGELSSPTWNAVSNFAKKLPSAIIGIIMALLSSYLFVAEKEKINSFVRSHLPQGILKRFDIVSRSVKKAVGGYIKAQFKIEVWVYLLLLIGFSIMQVEYAFLIALGVALLDILPFFGTGTVMVPWAIIKILSGNYQMAIGLLITWGVGQLLRQLIQPKYVGDSIGVPPLPTLILLYLGFKFGGVIGMIIAVPIGLILYSMYEEGVFDTTKKSILILMTGINRFRRIDDKDMLETEELLQIEKGEENEKY